MELGNYCPRACSGTSALHELPACKDLDDDFERSSASIDGTAKFRIFKFFQGNAAALPAKRSEATSEHVRPPATSIFQECEET